MTKLERRTLGFGVLAFAQIGFGVQGNGLDNFKKTILLLLEVLSCHMATGPTDYVLNILAARDFSRCGG